MPARPHCSGDTGQEKPPRTHMLCRHSLDSVDSYVTGLGAKQLTPHNVEDLGEKTGLPQVGGLQPPDPGLQHQLCPGPRLPAHPAGFGPACFTTMRTCSLKPASLLSLSLSLSLSHIPPPAAGSVVCRTLPATEALRKIAPRQSIYTGTPRTQSDRPLNPQRRHPTSTLN